MLFGKIISRNQTLASLWLACAWFKKLNKLAKVTFEHNQIIYKEITTTIFKLSHLQICMGGSRENFWGTSLIRNALPHYTVL